MTGVSDQPLDDDELVTVVDPDTRVRYHVLEYAGDDDLHLLGSYSESCWAGGYTVCGCDLDADVVADTRGGVVSRAEALRLVTCLDCLRLTDPTRRSRR